MNTVNVAKKLREAEFFLRKMFDQEREAILESEAFDFYLSAFLSAANSVRDGFYRGKKRPTIEAARDWGRRWQAGLTPEQKSIFDFLRIERDAHRSGSSRIAETEYREFAFGTHKLEAVAEDIIGSPQAGPPAVTKVPAYYFSIGGIERRATEACAEYLALLQRIVTSFEADYSQESDTPANG